MGTATNKNTAKQAIVDTFIANVEAESLHAVQVARLIKELKINRNTFYYHFPSKYDVALYVFRTDLAQELTRTFSEHELRYAPLSSTNTKVQLPFYVRREIGARTLDFGDFFKALVRCVYARHAFYSKLFHRTEPEFRTLIHELYRPAVEEDLQFVLGGRYLPRPTLELFCYRYTGLVYETAAYYLSHSRDVPDMLNEAVNPFWNMPYEALVHELQAHPVARPRNRKS